MKEQILDYFESLYKDIPIAVYEGLLSVLCLGTVAIIACYGLKRGWRKIVGLILVGYVFVIYCSTVIFRKVIEDVGYELSPFWSYEAIENGRSELLAENLMNVVVFVPIGMMLGSLFMDEPSCKAERRVKGSWLIALMVGIGISLSIEAMQYFFHRGFAETDDVMHNTIGCILGYMLVRGAWLMVRQAIRSRAKE